MLGLDLVGGEEAGVVGVADGLDQAVDRAVGQLQGVEGRRVDEVVVEDLPGLGVGRELGRQRAGDGGRRVLGRAGRAGVDPADADARGEDGDDEDDRADGLGDRRQPPTALLLARRGPGRAIRRVRSRRVEWRRRTRRPAERPARPSPGPGRRSAGPMHTGVVAGSTGVAPTVGVGGAHGSAGAGPEVEDAPRGSPAPGMSEVMGARLSGGDVLLSLGQNRSDGVAEG